MAVAATCEGADRPRNARRQNGWRFRNAASAAADVAAVIRLIVDGFAYSPGADGSDVARAAASTVPGQRDALELRCKTASSDRLNVAVHPRL